MFVPQFIKKRIQKARDNTLEKIQNAKDWVFKGGVLALICVVVIWVAIFLYVAFYYAYMPSISHIRPVHLQFTPCNEVRGICSFPSAQVQLTKRQQILMVGQPYRMYLNLDMPESPANKRLGMFMVCIHLRDKEGITVATSCRSTMLHYRSYIIHTISTLFYSPFMILGSTEEKQFINLELFNDFEEDQSHPVTDIFVEIKSRHVELYSAFLQIQAHFTGLRYLMFHWPVLSAIVGISSNLFFIVLVCLLSWLRLYQINDDDDDNDSSYVYQKMDFSQKKEGLIIFKGEDDSSFEDASFIEEINGEGQDDKNGFHDGFHQALQTPAIITRRTSSSDC